MTRLIAFALLAVPLLADDKKPANPDLNGKWEVASATYDGNEQKATAGARLEFADGEFQTLKNGKVVRTIKFTVDPKESPKRINMVNDKGDAAPGIYKVDKDELTLCYRDYGDSASGPPEKFESKPGGRMYLIVLKRVKD
jgi:uncharacterized protein (TIGR03067 family)